MRVAVTGGSGLAGRAVVEDLVARGYAVTNVDLVPSDGPAAFRRAELGDLGQVYGCLRGADAVVHLAAIPCPTFDVPEVVFRTNVMGTFNVLEAASPLGVRRVVSASSVSVLGTRSSSGRSRRPTSRSTRSTPCCRRTPTRCRSWSARSWRPASRGGVA